MTTENLVDPYVQSLINSKDADAVIKLRLINHKAKNPGCLVFAFEGPSDKLVYAAWIRRIRNDLTYEPFICKTKDLALRLIVVARRDLSGLERDTYFFVDKDFDGLRGIEPSSNVFVTDRYSIENYLVSSEVLDDVLKNEFHCHGNQDVRSSIGSLFYEQYLEFLRITRDLNKILFLSKTLNIGSNWEKPDSISDLADVSINCVDIPKNSKFGLPEISDEIDREKLSVALEEFEKLDPQQHYRGKYAYKFFRHWLELLGREHATPKLGIFGEIARDYRANVGALQPMRFAGVSGYPQGLDHFLAAI